MLGGTRRETTVKGRDDPAAAPWGVWEIVVAVMLTATALVVVFGVLALALPSMGVELADEDSRASAVTLILAQIVVDGAGVGIAAALSLRRYGRGPGAWGLRREQPLSLGLCLLTLVAALATFPVYAGIVQVLGLEMLEPRSNVPEMLVDDRAVLPLAFLLIVVVAPLAEEMFFRGFVFNGLRNAHVPRKETSPSVAGGPDGERTESGMAPKMTLRVVGAGLVSGAMWAAIHSQLGLVIPITVVGLLFALLVARTGSLWNAIAVHAAFNLIGFTANVAAQGG